MSRKISRKQPVFYEDIQILDTAAEGKALAKINDKVLFLPFGAPGDLVDVEVWRSKSSYMEGRILKIKEKSPCRVDPFCTHFGLCGGCKWQHLSYEQQLIQKQKQVKDQLERIGKISLPPARPILGSPQQREYRNKLEFTFSPYRWLQESEIQSATTLSAESRAGLGFHLPGKFDKVLDIEKCHLQREPSNEIRLFIKAYALQHALPFYDVRSGEGLLRNLILRCNEKGEFMLILVLKTTPLVVVEPLFNALLDHFAQVISLQYCFNDKVNDSIADLPVIRYAGTPFLVACMPAFESTEKTLRFRVGPKSFYQTNTLQAGHLYRICAEMAKVKEGDLLYDLYTGTGTIGLFLAQKARKVIGIEYVPEAIEDARLNAMDNGITKAVFYAGDMAKVLNESFVAENGKPNVVVVDPPREGMHEKVVEQLLNMEPERIVYVSCNAATQARDLQKMDAAYQVTDWQCVDMFPHTFHVENVVLLEKR